MDGGGRATQGAVAEGIGFYLFQFQRVTPPLPKVEGIIYLNHIHIFKHHKLFISLKYKCLKYIIHIFMGQQ